LPANCASWSRHQSHIRSLSESKTTDDSQQLVEQANSPPENLLVLYCFITIFLQLIIKNVYILDVQVIG
jgi:hypothetical protein